MDGFSRTNKSNYDFHILTIDPFRANIGGTVFPVYHFKGKPRILMYGRSEIKITSISLAIRP